MTDRSSRKVSKQKSQRAGGEKRDGIFCDLPLIFRRFDLTLLTLLWGSARNPDDTLSLSLSFRARHHTYALHFLTVPLANLWSLFVFVFFMPSFEMKRVHMPPVLSSPYHITHRRPH